MELIEQSDSRFPNLLSQRLGGACPERLAAIGRFAILQQPLTALFCSTKCPGEVILRAFDQVAQLRDASRAVISGFHTPVEKECLAILLRGTSPIVICPARSLARYRVPSAWRPALAANRLLLLSPFADAQTRATAEMAQRRNEFVAALATEILVLHATPGGRLEMLLRKVEQGGRTVSRLQNQPTRLRVGSVGSFGPCGCLLACERILDRQSRRSPLRRCSFTAQGTELTIGLSMAGAASLKPLTN